MTVRRVAISTAACVALVFGSAWLFRMPLSEAALAAPIIVASVGALAFLAVLWTKVAWESLRRQRHRGWIVAGLLGTLALLVLLSFVVELPARY